MERLINYHTHPAWLLFGTVILFLTAIECFANESVSGQYITVTPSHVVFVVTVGQPTPSHLIIQHFHPAGSKFLTSSPDAVKISDKKHFSKWLMKEVQPGSYSFSLDLRGSDTSGFKLVLRYSDPSGGGFRESVIAP